MKFFPPSPSSRMDIPHHPPLLLLFGLIRNVVERNGLLHGYGPRLFGTEVYLLQIDRVEHVGVIILQKK